MEQWSKFAYQFTNGFFGIFSTNKKSSYAPMMAKKCVKNRISYAADDWKMTQKRAAYFYSNIRSGGGLIKARANWGISRVIIIEKPIA